MKLTPMQRKYLLRASLILLLITGSYLVLWSTTTGAHPQKEACSESMDECCKKKTDKEGSGEMIWETFSRQFIATSVTE
jgi:hypothetical protein